MSLRTPWSGRSLEVRGFLSSAGSRRPSAIGKEKDIDRQVDEEEEEGLQLRGRQSAR